MKKDSNNKFWIAMIVAFALITIDWFAPNTEFWRLVGGIGMAIGVVTIILGMIKAIDKVINPE